MRRMDLYRRVPVDLTEPTAPGAIISIVAVILMVLLFLGEVRSYVTPPSRSDMFVASDEGHGSKLRVNYNFTFYKLPCFVASLDVMDVLGRHEVNVDGHGSKVRIVADKVSGANVLEGGYRVVGPFDIEAGVSRFTDEQLKEMGSTEGCNLNGYVEVHKVPGNFHVSSHGLQHLVTKYMPGGQINVAHTIHHMHFGDTELHPDHTYEGVLNPLNGVVHRETEPLHYEYFLDIVPTMYTYRPKKKGASTTNSLVERGYQFTSNMHRIPNPPGNMPAVFFQYQLSPITVSYGFDRPSFSHFVTYMCAIIGGVFTVAGILSRSVNASAARIRRTLLGKND